LDGAIGLEKLANSLDRTLNEMCMVPLERRPFKAHLTTARVKEVNKLDIIKVRDLHSRALGDLIEHGYGIEVNELVLYSSTLTPKGPRYEKLRTFGLDSSS
jgi:2'-5' RNA ligase